MQRFSLLLIIRTVLILTNLILFALMLFWFPEKHLIFVSFILLVILIIQVYGLLRYVNITNRELTRFLFALKNSDFSLKYSESGLGESFNDLFKAFNNIIETFKQVTIEKEAQYFYLQSLVKHINVGIISLNGENDIVLMNKPAGEILGIPQYKHWDELGNKHGQFAYEINLIKGEGRKLIDLEVDNDTRHLSVSVNNLMILKEPYKIITFQNIKSEIEQKEIEAWHKLIRILRHEIMNSVTPISSLTETIIMLVEDDDGLQIKLAEISEEDIMDIRDSIKTIKLRSDGLYHFVDKYREVTKIPLPKITKFKMNDLFDSVCKLMLAEINKNNINLKVKYENKDMEVEADFHLVEQVLINLITNSIYALRLTSNPEITLIAKDDGIQKIIEIEDNGSGITKSEIDEIFIPFYSTKETGSGIGLSLSKQIMQLHGGTIEVRSVPDIKTVFTVRFGQG